MLILSSFLYLLQMPIFSQKKKWNDILLNIYIYFQKMKMYLLIIHNNYISSFHATNDGNINNLLIVCPLPATVGHCWWY